LPVPDIPVISTVDTPATLGQRLHQALAGSQQAVPTADRLADKIVVPRCNRRFAKRKGGTAVAW